MIEILPSLLTQSPEELRELIKKCDGEVKRVHIDILDGVYADNKTADPSAMNDLDHTLLLDFHLMVDEPVNWVAKCARAGADRIVAQIEMMSDQDEYIKRVVEAGCSPGLAIDMDTDPTEIMEDVLASAEVVLVMSVPAGFGGQKFHLEALDKIATLSQMRKERDLSFKIQDDGGITYEYIDDVRINGADEAIIGRRLFEGSIRENIEKFKAKA